MRTGYAARAAVTATALALSLAACGNSAAPADTGGTTGTTRSPSPEPTAASSTSPTASVTPTETSTGSASTLDWVKVPGSVDDVVTTNSRWTLTIDKAGSHATLTGPENVEIRAPQGFSIATALMDDQWAVVVASDRAMSQPGVATVIALDHPAQRYVLDGTSSPATVYGGAWTLGQGVVEHATRANGGKYCLATVDLATKAGQVDHCEQARHGFNNVRVTPAGLTLMSFDDQQPSCRTLLQVGEAGETPVPGVADCVGWEALPLADGLIWTEVPHANRIETATVHAQVGGVTSDLGPAISGSLTWCGDAAWWAQDAQTDQGSASLWRFDGTTTAEVYRTPPGPATISAPRCGGDHITVTALTAHGDEQVTAAVG